MPTRKDHFMGVRVSVGLFDWMKGYSDESGANFSQIMRRALLELKGRDDALRNDKEEYDLEVLKSHLGDMFRFRRTEEGLLLERIEPQTIVLGNGGRKKKNGEPGRESKTA